MKKSDKLRKQIQSLCSKLKADCKTHDSLTKNMDALDVKITNLKTELETAIKIEKKKSYWPTMAQDVVGKEYYLADGQYEERNNNKSCAIDNEDYSAFLALDGDQHEELLILRKHFNLFRSMARDSWWKNCNPSKNKYWCISVINPKAKKLGIAKVEKNADMIYGIFSKCEFGNKRALLYAIQEIGADVLVRIKEAGIA